MVLTEIDSPTPMRSRLADRGPGAENFESHPGFGRNEWQARVCWDREPSLTSVQLDKLDGAIP
ncbi:hypothetical protein [Laspinema olomoucense]|uniref:hypothetical protein n=1 Tax=Laspinema olomoucense TaxID=3231600 RepID=UPI0021BB49EA|nr:hypothetical protein [Laspinema sp. D3d]MCT7975891.1 hypothetical protein [Laspinema sp. D3d]